MSSDVAEVTRHIKQSVERLLWGRAAGRCEFSGCNRPLYRSPVTQEQVNLAEKAHIYSFSEGGPRGQGPHADDPQELNEISNLLLVCHDCHLKIDRHEERYPADLLRCWKNEHEDRVELVTDIDPLKRSNVLLYGAKIGSVAPQVLERDAIQAMFPEWYPTATPTPLALTMSWEGRDSDPDYWRTEETNLVRSFESRVAPLTADETHFSIFGLAPIPLLVKLGALLTDQVPAIVYQRHREPQTWRWLSGPTEVDYRTSRPDGPAGDQTPALVLALSDRISPDRVTQVLGPRVAIWTFTIENPHNDFLRSPDQLVLYRRALRQFLDEVGTAHGKHVPVHVFPAIPVACAIDLGRIRMPKVDAPWIVYDHAKRPAQFVEALTIGGRDA